MKNFLTIILLTGVVALTVSSCRSKGNSTGRIFMPDMTYSNAYETYSSTKFQFQSDTDAISAMLPVNGSIPRGYLPTDGDSKTDEAAMMSYMFKNYFENPLDNRSLDDVSERARAASMLKNPYLRTNSVLAEGKEIYTIYCAVCHGDDGKGMGNLVQLEDGSDGPYTAIPPNYETRLPGLSDGEIYYSISYGKNMMGGYYSQVNAQDRWKLVHYIKEMVGIEQADAPAVINVDEIVVEAGTEINLPDIYYNTGSAELKSESFGVLNQLMVFFQSNDNVIVEIGSHADGRGDYDQNMELSQDRAVSVVDYLMSKGVSLDQMIPLGYGSSMPAVDCTDCTEEEHQQNRRTTFKILEVN